MKANIRQGSKKVSWIQKPQYLRGKVTKYRGGKWFIEEIISLPLSESDLSRF